MAGGPSRSGERLAAVNCRPPTRRGSHRGRTVTDSHTPGLPATSATERTAGFAPRYYTATQFWASTTTAGTLLPNRVAALTSISSGTCPKWDTPGPSARHLDPPGGQVGYILWLRWQPYKGTVTLPRSVRRGGRRWCERPTCPRRRMFAEPSLMNAWRLLLSWRWPGPGHRLAPGVSETR